jgi:hypothetical protein
MERWLKRQGFNLHAGVVIGAHNREGLERLCRYVARPPLSSKRMYIHRSALWSFIRLRQRKCCRDWEEEDHRKRGPWRSLALQGEGRDRRGARGGWRGGVLGAICADFERFGEKSNGFLTAKEGFAPKQAASTL